MTSFLHQPMDVSMMSTHSTTRQGHDPSKSRLNILEDNDVERGDGQSVFKSLDETIHMDFHAALHKLAQEPDTNIWPTLYELLELLHKALGILISSGETGNDIKSAARHVHSEYRLYELLLIEQSLLEEFQQYKDISYLGELICNDREFRMLYALWRWCQEGASNDPRGFSDLVNEYNGMSTVRNIRAGTLRAISMGNKGVGVDLDAKCTQEDQHSEERLMKIVFSLIRCGKIDEAISLVSSVGLPSLATPLHMYHFLTDYSMSPTDALDENCEVAKKRIRFVKTLRTLVGKAQVSPFHRMVWSALSGMLDPIYSMATSADDRLWCLVNAAVHHRLQDACCGDSMIAEDIPLTVEAIFGEIVAEERSPYYRFFGLILREEWAELIDCMTSLLKDQLIDDQLIRFMANMVTVARIKGYEFDEESSLPLISSLISGLSVKGLFSLIPFYATFLPRPEAEQTLLQIMQGIKSEDDRLDYLKALEEAGFAHDTLAILSAEHHEHMDLTPLERIDRLTWLLLNGERTLDQAIVQTNNLFRYFMVSDDMDSASLVLRQTLGLAVAIGNMDAASLSDAVLSEVNEYRCHQQFFDTFACASKLAEHAVQLKAFQEASAGGDASCSEWAPVGLTECTERAVEKRQRDNEMNRKRGNIDIYKHKALDGCLKLLQHSGWRWQSAAQPSRSDQLSAMRDMCYTSVLEMTVAACHTVNDDETVMDIAVMLADEDLKIQKWYSKSNLRHILDLIHTYAGHILSEEAE